MFNGRHYQVDVIGGDGHASAYKFRGSNQHASSYELSLFQQVFKSFRDAFISCQGSPKLRFTSEDLRYFEQHYGKPWNELRVQCVALIMLSGLGGCFHY